MEKWRIQERQDRDQKFQARHQSLQGQDLRGHRYHQCPNILFIPVDFLAINCCNKCDLCRKIVFVAFLKFLVENYRKIFFPKISNYDVIIDKCYLSKYLICLGVGN